MRLTIVIILTTVFQLSAARSFGQQFTYVGKNIPLIKFFKEIQKQTGYSTVWSGNDLDLSETVDADYHNAPLEEVLKTSLAGLPIDYVIVDKTISLKGKGQLSKIKVATDSSAIDIRGRVVDEKNQPLVGATVKIRGTKIVTQTDTKGYFMLNSNYKRSVLIISHVGYNSVSVSATNEFHSIRMIHSLDQLKQVEVVSSGYQKIPLERATGSYVLINNELLNRSVSTNILDRLKGVTSGLLTDNTTGTDVGFSIRGRSTIFANTNPLIILDNFPYDGDLGTINPNDVENISVLKDAAAAAIWGVRASNGVVVITTKKGQFGQSMKVGFNSNVTIGEKPDLFSSPQIGVSSYIEMERFLFEKGKFSYEIATPHVYISPVVDILSTQTDPNEIERQLNVLKQQDVRNDLLKYYYRNAINQQYSLSFDGGGKQNEYYFSMGYDHNKLDYVSDSNERLSLNAQNTYRLFNDKLQARFGISYTSLIRTSNSGNVSGDEYIKPYTMLVGQDGNALSLSKFKRAWLDTIGAGRLLDWNWKPIEELNRTNNTRTLNNYVLSLDLKYKIVEGLDIQSQYQFTRGLNEIDHLHTSDSYYVRDLVNQFSVINYATNEVLRPVPLGNILGKTILQNTSKNLRLQLNYTKSLLNHSLSVLAGSDIKDYNNQIHGYTMYGYDKENGLVSNMDFATRYSRIYDGLSTNVPGKSTESGQTDRYISWFSNLQYAYKEKLIASGSIRIDESNLFGVKANQKKVPLWSAGGTWIVTKDFFRSAKWLDQLRVRGTYGYNGNVDKTVSAFVTAATEGTNRFGQPTTTVINPPNPSLRWEKIRMINLALEYSIFNSRLSGSIEYYHKYGKDIIGNSPLAPSSGISFFKGNSAFVSGDGFDVTISSYNIAKSNFGWHTVFLISKTQDRITAYNVNTQPLAFHVGYPYNGIFSYRWAGLDPLTGDPLGYYEDKLSRDWGSINVADSLHKTSEYIGPGTPTYFGSIRNRFTYKNLSLSFNIIYKFGYYFRSNSVDYTRAYIYGQNLHRDYNKRWLQPGDELKTNIPSAPYPSNYARDYFYTYSSILVEKGDHIRLQDIRLSYDINKKRSAFNNASIYLYASNLGLVWKANRKGLDPESQSIPLQKNISIGFKTQF